MLKHGMKAPELEVEAWLNTPQPLTLSGLKGRVVLIHAFQMLCPGCVMHGLPQAASVAELYPTSEVQVIGLHSVFEHHDVMTVEALKVFIHEYRITFPVAVDRPSPHNPMPMTMRKLKLQGTPSLVLIDKAGCIRFQHFGRLNDLQLGDMIGRLSTQTRGVASTEVSASTTRQGTAGCDDGDCSPL